MAIILSYSREMLNGTLNTIMSFLTICNGIVHLFLRLSRIAEERKPAIRVVPQLQSLHAGMCRTVFQKTRDSLIRGHYAHLVLSGADYRKSDSDKTLKRLFSWTGLSIVMKYL